MSHDKYLHKTALKARGWTPSLIQLLGIPDLEGANPYHWSGPSIQYYQFERVEAMELSPEFRAKKEKAAKRSAVAKEAAGRREEQLITAINSVEIRIPDMEFDELIRRACESYNSLGRSEVYADPNSDQEFLDRICGNYLRHVLSPYEVQMSKVAGKTGAVRVRQMIRSRILDAISDAYPELTEACDRQEERYEQAESRYPF